jgi:hypothetical protein
MMPYSLSALFVISKSKCLRPRWEKQVWVVLVLTICQLSAINYTACKRSVLALTSLAADDDVSRFSLIASRMLFTKFARYMILNFSWFPCSLAVPGMWCWETEMPVGYFSRNLWVYEGLLHSFQEPVKFSSISIIVLRPNSLASSSKFQTSTMHFC